MKTLMKKLRKNLSITEQAKLQFYVSLSTPAHVFADFMDKKITGILRRHQDVKLY